MKEPCTRVADLVTFHPGEFEMQILKAFIHLHEAQKLADANNYWTVSEIIHKMLRVCRHRELAAKVLNLLPCKTLDLGPRLLCAVDPAPGKKIV